MRTISALLLFATTFFSHGQGHLANPVPFGFSVDLEMARIISYETDVIQITDEIIEIYISLEVYFEEIVLEPKVYDHQIITGLLPRHLNTLSLVAYQPSETINGKLQKNLNRSLTMNDFLPTKGKSHVNWLAPVRYNRTVFGAPNQLPEGFGPRLSL